MLILKILWASNNKASIKADKVKNEIDGGNNSDSRTNRKSRSRNLTKSKNVILWLVTTSLINCNFILLSRFTTLPYVILSSIATK